MDTRSTILSKLADARREAERVAKAHPDEAPWSTLFSLLESYENLVKDHWPLTQKEKESGSLGWFSVRNIEEPFPQLHASLSDIAYNLRHSGE